MPPGVTDRRWAGRCAIPGPRRGGQQTGLRRRQLAPKPRSRKHLLGRAPPASSPREVRLDRIGRCPTLRAYSLLLSSSLLSGWFDRPSPMSPPSVTSASGYWLSRSVLLIIVLQSGGSGAYGSTADGPRCPLRYNQCTSAGDRGVVGRPTAAVSVRRQCPPVTCGAVTRNARRVPSRRCERWCDRVVRPEGFEPPTPWSEA